MSAPISVLVVDDDLFVRETLTDYLRDADDLTLAGTYPDAESALPAVGEHRPDVVLMDVRLPGMSGIEATREVTRRSAGTRVLALTSFGDADVVVQMLAAGAHGFLLKSTRAQTLLHAIRVAHSGLAVVPQDTLQEWATGRLAAGGPVLSAREQAVLRGLDLGLTNRQIAAELYLSTSTVKAHVADLLRKLDAPTRTRVVARAHALGMLPGADG